MDELTVLTWRVPHVQAEGLEAVTLPEKDRVQHLRMIRDAAGATELVYIPTCQRVVIALLHAKSDADKAVQRGYEEILGRDITPAEAFRARAAFRHLGEIASSLDSLVIGEPQVLGQFKDAFRQSDEAHLSGPGLRHVFGLVFRAAKAVRNDTELFRGKVSLIPLTEDLVDQHVANKPRVRALVLGTGQIGTRMAQLLREKRPDMEIHVVSRDATRASEVANLVNATPTTLERHMADVNAEYDIVACAMGAEKPILHADYLLALASKRDVLVLDLAIPRNAQAPENAPSTLRLVQIDDLTRMSLAQTERRAQEIEPAKMILDKELDRIEAEYESRKLAHDLAQLATRFEETARERLTDAPQGGPADPAFQKWFEQTVRALLHEATTAVKKAGCDPHTK